MDIHLELNLPIQFPFSVVHPNRDHDQRGKREWERAQWAPTDTGCQLRLLAWSLSMRVNAIGKYFFVFSSRLDGSHIIQSVCLPSFRRPKLLHSRQGHFYWSQSRSVACHFCNFCGWLLKRWMFSYCTRSCSVPMANSCLYPVHAAIWWTVWDRAHRLYPKIPHLQLIEFRPVLWFCLKTSEVNIWNTRRQQVKTITL